MVGVIWESSRLRAVSVESREKFHEHLVVCHIIQAADLARLLI
jgi:hypothetical protein